MTGPQEKDQAARPPLKTRGQLLDTIEQIIQIAIEQGDPESGIAETAAKEILRLIECETPERSKPCCTLCETPVSDSPPSPPQQS